MDKIEKKKNNKNISETSAVFDENAAQPTTLTNEEQSNDLETCVAASNGAFAAPNCEAETAAEVLPRNKNEMDMTNGNLAKKILQFSLPVILSGELQLLYNAADLIVCGIFRPGTNCVGAISATSALINLIINLFLGLAVGANVLMARCFGSRQQEKGQRVVYTAMILSVIVGVIIGIFGACFARYFLVWMNTGEDLLPLSTTYLTIYFLGVPFSMIYNFGASILRAVGDTKRPFIFLATAGLFNVGFNLFFVVVCGMDVDGVALGTILSQAISAGCVVVCLLKYKGFFRFRLKEMRFHKAEAIEIAKIGLPAGFQGVIFSLSNVMLQSSVNSLDPSGKYLENGELNMYVNANGNGASSSIEGFVYTTMNSVAQAAIAFISANFGAKKYKNIKKSLLYCLLYVFVLGMTTGALATIFGKQLLAIYLPSNPEAIEIGYTRLCVICLTYFLCGFMDTFAYALRGIGYSTLPTVVTLIGVCGSRFLWIFVFFPMEQLHSLQGLMLSYPISWLLTAAVNGTLFCVMYRRQKRKAAELQQEHNLATDNATEI